MNANESLKLCLDVDEGMLVVMRGDTVLRKQKIDAVPADLEYRFFVLMQKESDVAEFGTF